ncbi:MAG: LLM class flavin-dependent oxidoreductase, partial [Acidimicrobiales bacterium]
PVRPAIPVHLAGSGPNMISLAGEVSDGVGVGILVSPDHLRDMIRPTAAGGAAKAGRDPDELSFPMAAWVSVNPDREEAMAAARFAIVGLFHPVPHPYYDLQLRLQGFADVADMASELMPAGRTREAMDRVGDDVVEALTITGTPEECAAKLERYRGLADEVIALRVPQRQQPAGPAAYDDLLEMVTIASAMV